MKSIAPCDHYESFYILDTSNIVATKWVKLHAP